MPRRCHLPKASTAAPLQMKTESEDMLFCSYPSAQAIIHVFNIPNSVPFISLLELSEVKHSKIKENNGLNPGLEFSVGKIPHFCQCEELEMCVTEALIRRQELDPTHRSKGHVKLVLAWERQSKVGTKKKNSKASSKNLGLLLLTPLSVAVVIFAFGEKTLSSPKTADKEAKWLSGLWHRQNNQEGYCRFITSNTLLPQAKCALSIPDISFTCVKSQHLNKKRCKGILNKPSAKFLFIVQELKTKEHEFQRGL